MIHRRKAADRRRPESLPCPLCGETSPRRPASGRNPVFCCPKCSQEFGVYQPKVQILENRP